MMAQIGRLRAYFPLKPSHDLHRFETVNYLMCCRDCNILPLFRAISYSEEDEGDTNGKNWKKLKNKKEKKGKDSKKQKRKGDDEDDGEEEDEEEDEENADPIEKVDDVMLAIKHQKMSSRM